MFPIRTERSSFIKVVHMLVTHCQIGLLFKTSSEPSITLQHLESLINQSLFTQMSWKLTLFPWAQNNLNSF